MEAMAAASGLFLSTSPAWGTTQVYQADLLPHNISIHVPRVGDDL